MHPSVHSTAPASPLPRRRFLRQLLATPAALSVGLSLAACRSSGPQGKAIAAGESVLALGDSLTHGVGASATQAYPHRLAEATGWHVTNAGVSGDTSAQALQRLPGLLQAHQPRLVIVGIGGNDFLRRQSASVAEQNIRAICQQCLDTGAQVVLVAVPALNLLAAAGVLKDHRLYADIASDLPVALLEGAWSHILSDSSLRADQVHANAQGYAAFTEALLGALRDWGMWRA